MSSPMPQEPIRCEVEVDVRYAETDQMGVVHHANYLIWFEHARTQLCRDTGVHYADIERAGYLMMVTGAEVHYRQGARYGDRVAISTWIEKLGSRVTVFHYEVRRDESTLATGRTRHVWVRAEDSRPCRIPEMVRTEFERLAAAPLRSVKPG